MYREQPENSHDSGWRFFSGKEDQAYADNPNNFSFYSLNTIANYDPLIIPYLGAAAGTAFERNANDNEFFLVEDNEDDRDL